MTRPHSPEVWPPRVPEDPFFDQESVVSATDCTGLMPTQVEFPDQADQLSQLEGIHRIKPENPPQPRH